MKLRNTLGSKISNIDHIDLYTNDLAKTITFYETLLNEKVVIYGENRRSIYVGDAEIKFVYTKKSWAPKWFKSTPGTINLCFRTNQPILKTIKLIKSAKIPLFKFSPQDQEIYSRSGRFGNMQSIYIVDPNNNLIEFAHY